MGTSLGVPGAIVPLVVSAAPFVARIVEQSIAEVDPSLVEAAQSFGASSFQIVYKVLLKEALPSIVRGVAITFVNLFGYSAMAGTVVSALLPEALPSIVRGISITLIAVLGYTAIAGAVGAGGLGDIAIRYGYQRWQADVMLAAVILCVILVQVFQSVGDFTARKIDRRRIAG